MIKVAVDAMGGDNAPEEIVAGAVMAANTRKDIKILLVGQEERVSAELKKHTYNTDQIEIVNATEVIETEEPPVNAIRKKKDSSIVVGMNMVRRDEADAFVLRCYSGRRPGNRRKNQGSGAASPGTAYSDGEGSVPPD